MTIRSRGAFGTTGELGVTIDETILDSDDEGLVVEAPDEAVKIGFRQITRKTITFT